MAKFCGQCGSRLNETAMFCGGCGGKVPVASVAPTPAPVATPAPFTPVPPAPQPGAYAPAASAYTSVESTFSPLPPAPPSDPGGFAPVTFTSTPAPVTPAPDPGGFAPVTFTSTPAPVTPAPDLGGFAPVSFTPAPAIPIPATSSPQPGAFAPVQGYTPSPAAYTPAAPSYAPPVVASYTPPAASYAPAPAAYTPATAYPAKKSNTLLKIVIAFVLLIFVGGALALAGLWYAAQQIKAKAHAVRAQVLRGETPSTPGVLGGLLSDSSSDENPGGFKGDPCRFLSKAEVSQAVGVTVIRTESSEAGCSYIAKGDPADMTAKHLSSMIGGMGADAKTQQMAQKFAGGLFAQQEASDKSLAAEAATGEIPVLGLSFTAGHAELEMKANRGAFNHLAGGAPFGGGKGPAASQATGDLAGIGDEAYVAGGGLLMVRKGNTLVRFMYVSCPCNTDNIKPLAQMVASRL